MHEHLSNPTAMGFAVASTSGAQMPGFIKSLIHPKADANKRHNNLACGIVKQKMPSLHFNSEVRSRPVLAEAR
jgi:hypothetical protein